MSITEMNEVENIEKQQKSKTVGRISRLFQKKPKKKTSTSQMSSSMSSLSISDTSLPKPINSYQRSIASSSHISTEGIPERSGSIDSRHPESSNHNSISLSRNMSMSSNGSVNIQHLINQQRHLLADLDSQKQMYQADVAKLQEQLVKTQEKNQQRTHDMETLKTNYNIHLKSVRSSNDDVESIGQKLIKLKESIHTLASELLPHADPQITSDKLSTLWINLGDAIKQLGTPLSPPRIQMLTEKFMMDVLVQNLNIHIFPGLTCNESFLELSTWFEQHDSSPYFATRLRQELSLLVVQNKGQPGHEIEVTWKKCVDRNWHHLYRGLQKAYPNYLLSSAQLKEPVETEQMKIANEYGRKLRKLVEETISLGSAIKGQEECITAVDVREGLQPFDPYLMVDEDGQASGTIAFCISPPFVVKRSNRYEPLVKGRVLCFPTP